MKSKILGLLAVALLAGPMAANAAVMYRFDFFNIEDTVGSLDDFDVTLIFNDYIQTSGMFASSASIPTTVGYPVSFVGANSRGWWGFDDDGGAIMLDYAFIFGPDDGQLLAFLFVPTDLRNDYFSAPGTYSGLVTGNASSTFGGRAVLTITDTSVPEPGTLALLGLGLTGLALGRKRKAA